MEHIHLLVSTFDTNNVAVAHNLEVLLKTTLRDQDQDQDQTGRDQDRDQDQGGQDQDQDQDQDHKKWSWSVSRPRSGLETHIPAVLMWTSVWSGNLLSSEVISLTHCIVKWWGGPSRKMGSRDLDL